MQRPTAAIVSHKFSVSSLGHVYIHLTVRGAQGDSVEGGQESEISHFTSGWSTRNLRLKFLLLWYVAGVDCGEAMAADLRGQG